MTNMWDGTNYFLQDILNFQPRIIFESYTFYPIWGQYFDPRVILGWRYTRVSTVLSLSFQQNYNSVLFLSVRKKFKMCILDGFYSFSKKCYGKQCHFSIAEHLKFVG